MADAQAPDAIRLASHDLSFAELKELVEYLGRMQEDADASLEYFRHDAHGGFAHQVVPGEEPEKSSKASTATCLAYVQAVGKLRGDSWPQATKDKLRTQMIDEKWTSAGLPIDNPFTTSFLLETIHILGGEEGLTPSRAAKVRTKIEMLDRMLSDGDGGLSIDKYPPTAFLTYKAVRVLDTWEQLTDEASEKVAKWTWDHLSEESMLIAAESPDADYFELAYAALTASVTTRLERMTPRERRLLQHGIGQFFAGQRKDGTWPRSRPLFLYPDIGYAYCYDYELLVQLLSEPQLRPFVYPHLGGLRKAAWALAPRRVPLKPPERAYGWSSEHHGEKYQAESWPTASVFHFCFELGRLISEAVRRDVFEYVDSTYEDPSPEVPVDANLDALLDSWIRFEGKRYKFKTRFESEFLEPLRLGRDQVRDGRPFEKGTQVSAIIFGPPGTSKTRLADLVSKALGWPLLAIDPSHLTRRGLDNVHAEANELFSRLRLCDQVVVLLDEFDELIREREGTGEMESRFLTTAMLPKIAALHERRRLVYIVATNHPEQFDAAISRPGRFDVIAPLLPPSADAKTKEWKSLKDARDTLVEDGVEKQKVNALLEDLTYMEAEALAKETEEISSGAELLTALERAQEKGALNQAVDPKEDASDTWKQRMDSQSSITRGLGL